MASLVVKQSDDQLISKALQKSVTLVYEVMLAERCCNLTMTWNKNLINYSLTFTIENPSNENHFSFKIDLKAWQLWGKKGIKSFQVEGGKVDVYWNFRHAKFSSNPEPSSTYYVALVYQGELVLMLGDLKKDAYKRTKTRPPSFEPILLCKKENVYGKKLFCTKAMLDNGMIEHDIIIEMSSRHDNPELWISIDNFEVIHVMNLHWRFRGNEKVTIDNLVIEIFWDVHDWLFNESTCHGTSHGLFIFKPEVIDDAFNFDTTRNGEGSGNFNDKSGLICDSSLEVWTPISGFLHVIYAWKFE